MPADTPESESVPKSTSTRECGSALESAAIPECGSAFESKSTPEWASTFESVMYPVSGCISQKQPISDAYDPEAFAHFAQVLAHRLRGLVTGIEGFTDLLADSLMSRDQRELALKILEGAARIESVLADLQLYGEPVDPVLLTVDVEDVVSVLLPSIPDEERGRIELHVAPSERKRTLKADPYLIRQALLVLVQNALQASGPDGTVRVEVAASESTKHVRLSVWNDGVIGVEDAERLVFVPFYTTKAHNLGVGLSIARRIAQVHNGTVSLTNNSAEEGVQFSLVLPAAT